MSQCENDGIPREEIKDFEEFKKRRRAAHAKEWQEERRKLGRPVPGFEDEPEGAPTPKKDGPSGDREPGSSEEGAGPGALRRILEEAEGDSMKAALKTADEIAEYKLKEIEREKET